MPDPLSEAEIAALRLVATELRNLFPDNSRDWSEDWDGSAFSEWQALSREAETALPRLLATLDRAGRSDAGLDAGVVQSLHDAIERDLTESREPFERRERVHGTIDRWCAALAPATGSPEDAPTTDEIAVQEGLKPESLRQALRESHPDASPSEVIGRAHDIEENT